MNVVLPKQIWTNEGDLLAKKAEEVFDMEEGREIAEKLKKTLLYYGGVGLAAPQIGISKRVFAVNIMPDKDYPDFPKIGCRVYFNPQILEVSSEKNFSIEGCLSVLYGSLYGEVERRDFLKIKYTDIYGKKNEEETVHPFHTRVILHENDHLDGKVFLEKIDKEKMQTLFWDESLDIRKRKK